MFTEKKRCGEDCEQKNILDYNNPFEVDNSGSLLCSWLSGDDDKEGVWFDRYYNPQKVSYFGLI